jgi:hypothetical protein
MNTFLDAVSPLPRWLLDPVDRWTGRGDFRDLSLKQNPFFLHAHLLHTPNSQMPNCFTFYDQESYGLSDARVLQLGVLPKPTSLELSFEAITKGAEQAQASVVSALGWPTVFPTFWRKLATSGEQIRSLLSRGFVTFSEREAITIESQDFASFEAARGVFSRLTENQNLKWLGWAQGSQLLREQGHELDELTSLPWYRFTQEAVFYESRRSVGGVNELLFLSVKINKSQPVSLASSGFVSVAWTPGQALKVWPFAVLSGETLDSELEAATLIWAIEFAKKIKASSIKWISDDHHPNPLFDDITGSRRKIVPWELRLPIKPLRV